MCQDSARRTGLRGGGRNLADARHAANYSRPLVTGVTTNRLRDLVPICLSPSFLIGLAQRLHRVGERAVPQVASLGIAREVGGFTAFQ
jgi:hypothetical protein